MALRQARLYYNTGFKVGEVPDSPNLLNSCQYLDLSNHWDYQDYYLTTFKVAATYDQVKNADYLKYGNGYYFITSVKMLNENTAMLYLELDALTTLGGPLNLNYNGGIVAQAHTRSDSYLGNTIEPRIGCSQILRLRGFQKQIPVSGVNVVASTLDLSYYPPKSINDINEAYCFRTDVGMMPTEEGESRELTVAVPSALPASKTTSIAGVNTTAGFGYYNGNNDTVKANIKYLRDLGIEGALLYSYIVPSDYITNGSHGHITKIGNTATFAAFDTSITADYGSYKNKKTYTTYSKYVLQSVLSGDTQTYDVADIAYDNGNILFNNFVDAQYGGKIYCYPLNYKGIADTTYNLSRGVKSLPWKDYPISFTTMSGSQWAANEYAFKDGQISRNLLGESLAGGASSAVSSIEANLLGGITSLYFGLGSIYSGDYSMYDKVMSNMPGNLGSMEFNKAKNRAEYLQKQVIVPDLSCSPALGLQNLWPYQFLLFHMYPTDTDLQRIDDYYTQYGYPMGNCAFNKNMLSGRQYFNYIEASDIHIVRNGGAANAGLPVILAAEAQINAGVRIWHTLPQPVSNNPIV